MAEQRRYIESKILTDKYNLGYQWYVLNRNNDKLLGPFDSAELADDDLEKDKDNYLQLMTPKMVENMQSNYESVNIDY